MFNYLKFISEEQVLQQLFKITKTAKPGAKFSATFPLIYRDDVREWFRSLQEYYELAFCFDIRIRKIDENTAMLVIEYVRKFDSNDMFQVRRTAIQRATIKAKPLMQKWKRPSSYFSNRDVLLDW